MNVVVLVHKLLNRVATIGLDDCTSPLIKQWSRRGGGRFCEFARDAFLVADPFLMIAFAQRTESYVEEVEPLNPKPE